MCVAVPVRIVAIDDGPLPMADTDVAGRPGRCCLAYLPEAAVGDYVLVQHGFAVQLLDARSAAASLAAFARLGVLTATEAPAGDGR